MDRRRESQTVGESTVNNSTAIFRPYNVPAMIGCPSSQVTFTLPQSTYLMPPSSSASLSRVGDYSQSLANEVRIRICMLQFAIIYNNNIIVIHPVLCSLFYFKTLDYHAVSSVY